MKKKDKTPPPRAPDGKSKGKGKVPAGNRPPAFGAPNRGARRRQLKMLKGGRADEPEPLKRQDDKTPAGRFYNALDQFVKNRALNDKRLDESSVTVALMQFTAHICARFSIKFSDAIDPGEFADTIRRMFEEEVKAARAQGQRPNPPPPGNPA